MCSTKLEPISKRWKRIIRYKLLRRRKQQKLNLLKLKNLRISLGNKFKTWDKFSFKVIVTNLKRYSLRQCSKTWSIVLRSSSHKWMNWKTITRNYMKMWLQQRKISQIRGRPKWVKCQVMQSKECLQSGKMTNRGSTRLIWNVTWTSCGLRKNSLSRNLLNSKLLWRLNWPWGRLHLWQELTLSEVMQASVSKH